MPFKIEDIISWQYKWNLESEAHKRKKLKTKEVEKTWKLDALHILILYLDTLCSFQKFVEPAIHATSTNPAPSVLLAALSTYYIENLKEEM